MALSTIGSIATNIYSSFDRIPTAVSGAVLVDIVDAARQTVANYVNTSIGSNSIDAKYQPAILSLAKSDVIGVLLASAGGGGVSLSELNMYGISSETQATYKYLADIQLKLLGKGTIQFVKSLS